MWHEQIYEKSLIDRWIYNPVATVLWVGLLFGAAYNLVSSGKVQSWALPLVGVGFALFLIAKIQMIISGKLFSCETDLASNKPWQIALPYVAGYIFMITGFIVSFN